MHRPAIARVVSLCLFQPIVIYIRLNFRRALSKGSTEAKGISYILRTEYTLAHATDHLKVYYLQSKHIGRRKFSKLVIE
jgi:hypothetical protein